MNCIKCGCKIPEGELFCVTCSLIPSVPAVQKPPGKAKAAPEKPGKQPRPKATAAAHPAKAAPRPATPAPAPRRRPVKLAISLVLMCLIAAGLAAFILLNWGKLLEQRTNLRVREADMTLQENDLAELKQLLAEAEKQLETATAQIQEQNQQVEDLKKQLNGTQSTMSQTQFDMTTQQQTMAELMTENEQLTAVRDQLTQQTEELRRRAESLATSSAAYGVKADFMDAYVVFVNNDESKLYHKYDCKDFGRQSFWAYSRKLAESSGFSACPVCK